MVKKFSTGCQQIVISLFLLLTLQSSIMLHFHLSRRWDSLSPSHSIVSAQKRRRKKSSKPNRLIYLVKTTGKTTAALFFATGRRRLDRARRLRATGYGNTQPGGNNNGAKRSWPSGRSLHGTDVEGLRVEAARFGWGQVSAQGRGRSAHAWAETSPPAGGRGGDVGLGVLRVQANCTRLIWAWSRCTVR
jgi:hypothetical protein